MYWDQTPSSKNSLKDGQYVNNKTVEWEDMYIDIGFDNWQALTRQDKAGNKTGLHLHV